MTIGRLVVTLLAAADAVRISSRALESVRITSRNTRKTLADVRFAAHAASAASHSMISEPKTVARILNLIPRKALSMEEIESALSPTSARSSAGSRRTEKTVTFTGCGGLYVYLFGVAAYMQSSFSWDPNTTAFASASAGAYPAFLLASGIDVEAFHHSANREFIEAVAASNAHRDPRVT